jgi:hypothetical protein
VGRLAESLAQNADLFTPAVTGVLAAMGASLKAAGDRLGRVVAPALHPPALAVKDGETEESSAGPLIGEAPAAEPTPASLPASDG